MRLLYLGAVALCVGAFAACSPATPPASDDDPPTQLLSGPLPDTGHSTSSPSTTNVGKSTNGVDAGASSGAPPNVDPATVGHPEVVYLIMAGKDGWTWFCTASLISPTVAVTAAHCLQDDLFASWEVEAPTVAGVPKIPCSKVAMYDDQWDDVAHPDIGIVHLDSPIQLPQYAVLTDVSSQVDANADVEVQTIVRTAEEPEAPFHKTDSMKLSSTVKYGYTHGYGVPMYSHGGDSGAGLFLAENGQMTHKLVATEREPDPDRKLDHLSRVESGFISWVGTQFK